MSALLPFLATLGSSSGLPTVDMTGTTIGIAILSVFLLGYALVVLEDVIHLRKSKPVLLAAGVMWILTSLALNEGEQLEQRVEGHLAEFGALFLFLMVAMTYISAIAKKNVFLKLEALLVGAGFGFRTVFWTTGAMAFLISPVADNMTTALLMGAVVTAVGRGNSRFISLACINIVIAANAGGAFSPFGDITTLMVWQAGKVATTEFFSLVPAALVNWLVPAFLMGLAVPKEKPAPIEHEVVLAHGWLTVILLFLATIVTAVLFHVVLHLPPFMGMMTGLGYYMIYGYLDRLAAHKREMAEPVDVFEDVAAVEWDTMLFFFGVLLGVGALSEIGYLAVTSDWLYHDLGATVANIGIGFVSAVIDNVPVMFAVLSMDPTMGTTVEAEHYQWLLVTLTAGVGGSLLSVGSAAGVALMGAAKGHYTFGRHLVWTPAILLGYLASIAVHHLLNAPPETVQALGQGLGQGLGG